MALKDKLMTLEDFKAVRDVDVASNNKQFTDIKADLGDLSDLETESKTDLVSAINEAAQSSLSDTAKAALLACFEHVVWDTDDYDELYDNLETALYRSGASTPAYSLSQPLVCDGNTYVSTGVKLYDIERDYTILLDATIPTNDNSVELESIVDCMDGENAPYPGLCIFKVKDSSTLFRYRIAQSPQNYSITDQRYNSGNHRLKLAVRTRPGEGITDIRGTMDGQEAVVTQGASKAFSATNKYIGLGGQIKMDGTTMYPDRYFKGTINDFKIYYRYLSDYDVQSFLS